MIAGAVISIGGSPAVPLRLHTPDLDATVVNIVTLLGLGLSIDYGLLTVNRVPRGAGHGRARSRPDTRGGCPRR